MKLIRREIKLRSIYTGATIFAFVVSAIITPFQALALDEATSQYYSDQGIYWYDPQDTSCSANTGVTSVGNTSSDASGVGGTGNKDYAGRTILSDAELSAIKENQSVYEQAGKAAGIPWQMVAVLHLRETGLKLVNPGNGQGLFQDYARLNGPYPAGPVDKTEFLRQATWAANFLKGKSSTPDKLAAGDVDAVKDAFYGYNGRASVYVTQAKSLGFTNGADGSPYVVNKIDAQRDPDKNPTGWGQIKSDGGGISYPANSDYGAFVVYASIANIATSSCSSDLTGTLNEKIVKAAQAELQLWTSGQLKPGDDYKKYTYGTSGDWCAWFVSYILKTAGKPVDSSSEPQWPAVRQFDEQSSSLGFTTHQKGDGYKPKPGDFAIYGNDDHINIVIGYTDSGAMITIGGNQAAGGNGNFTTSRVSQNTGYGESATKYIEVKE